MKNDINIIKNELLEQANEKKQKLLKQLDAQRREELKELIAALIYTTLKSNFNNGHDLPKIYQNRNLIIDTIVDDIEKQTIKIENKTSFTKEYDIIKKYPYTKICIESLVDATFEKQFKTFKSKYDNLVKIEKEQLKTQLKNRLKSIIDNRPCDVNLKDLLITLQEEETKNDIISELTNNKKQVSLLESIYYKVLNEVKRGYPTTNQRTTSNQIKIPLAWKALAITEVLKKMFK